MSGHFVRPWAILAVIYCLAGGMIDRAAAAQEPAQPTEPPAPAAHLLRSPDGSIEVSVFTAGPLTYSIRVDAQRVIAPSKLGLRFRDGTTFGRDVELVNATNQSVNSTWENPFGKRREVRDRYNQLHLLLREKSARGATFEVVFRAFDDGVGFRYELLSQPGVREFVLTEELTEFAFPADYVCFAGEQEKGFAGPQEWEFARRHLSDIKPDSIVGLPLLVETPAAWVAIAEADLLDWAGMWLCGAPSAGTAPTAAAKPANGPPNGDNPPSEGDGKASPPPVAIALAVKLAPLPDGSGLVKAAAPHSSAWRVLMIGRQPCQLIDSEIIRNLSTPSQVKDTGWIKPGKMAWDHWWTGDTIMTTEVIKDYIQLAADMGWPYQMIDWGWYGEANRPEADITQVVPALDMGEIRRFAEEKNVRLWLWLHWADVDRNDAYKKAFPLFKEWGIAGVKIDFMDRDDQEMVRWYEKITRAAADNELMVNFHGSFKAAGFDRTFPNQVTREGVLGNEYNKWSARVTPEHKVMLPFTRFLVGPADYTPGGFLNRQPGKFRAQKPTEVQGTRAAELALLVVYESPVACLCDHPDHYRGALGTDFLKIVPTVWDDTRAVAGEVGEYVAIARQSDDSWFLGALTNSQPRDVRVKLDFLGAGRWKMRLWRDAANAGDAAEQLATEERTVSADDTITLRLAPAGGCAAQFTKL